VAVYEFNNYKTFVNEALKNASGAGATRKELAQALSCQPSHVSAVLSGEGEFSAEQAEKVARFLKLGREQTEYFLLLVQCNRAGTPQLRNVYSAMLRQMRERTTPLRSKLEITDELSDHDKARYYSSWRYQAIHLLLSVPGFQTTRFIAERLGLSSAQVEDVLSFLVAAGLAEKSRTNVYKQLRPVLHLDRASVFVSRHHTNWRLKSIQSLDGNSGDDLHYSGVASLSEDDYLTIKRILSDALKLAVDVVRDSKEETIASICIDFFKL
jgi:uncharacterized protein (TIGR02147 family)